MDEDEIAEVTSSESVVSLEEALLLLGIPINVWEYNGDG